MSIISDIISRIKTSLIGSDKISILDSEDFYKPKTITFDNLKDSINTAEPNSILYGGDNSIDEDVYKLQGGVNGISLNSVKLTDE